MERQDLIIVFITASRMINITHKQEVYIPESYPNHYYHTNAFSPLFLAMNKEKKEEEL